MGLILAAIEVVLPIFLFMMLGRWYISRHWEDM